MAEDGTGDLSLIDGHYYAAKSPGLAFAVLPPYLLLKAAGGADPIRESRPEVWYLQLFGAVLPALVLLLLVARVAEGLEPGYGTAAAVTLGLTTMVLPFASMLFSHALSASLAFAAFAVLWAERRAPPRLLYVGLAGLLAGLAVTAEFPVVLVARSSASTRSSGDPGCPASAPTRAARSWACCRPCSSTSGRSGTRSPFSYANVVGDQESNKHGLFGITGPDFAGSSSCSSRRSGCSCSRL
jgi:hypothetical protein